MDIQTSYLDMFYALTAFVQSQHHQQRKGYNSSSVFHIADLELVFVYWDLSFLE